MAERLTTIPPPRPEDNDDVRWALSTATALWSSGASDDALKWLRRAGETASELDDDARAVELFKAAASIRTSMLPPPPAMTAVTWDQSGAEPVSEVRTRLDPRLVGHAQHAPRSAESPSTAPPATAPPATVSPATVSPATAPVATAVATAPPAIGPTSSASPSSAPPARRPPPPPLPRAATLPPASRRTPPPGLEAPPSSRRGSIPAAPPVPVRAARIGSIPPARPTPRMRSQHDTSLGIGKGESAKRPARVVMPSGLRETQIGLGAVRVQGGGVVPATAVRPSKVTPSSVKLSSTRFVVVPGTRRGELTLKAIASDVDPPAGTAVAVIVPRSINDAEMIDRILEAGAEFFDLHHDDQPTNPGAPGERTRRAC